MCEWVIWFCECDDCEYYCVGECDVLCEVCVCLYQYDGDCGECVVEFCVVYCCGFVDELVEIGEYQCQCCCDQ